MTLSSRHRIRNSSPGGLRSSTLPLGHGGSPQYWLLHVDGEETFFVSFKPPKPGTEPRTLAWKWAVLTTTLGPPPVRLFRIPMLWAYGHYIQYTLYRRGYVLSNLIIASVKLFLPVSIVFFRLCIVAEQCRGGHACRPLAGKLIAKC